MRERIVELFTEKGVTKALEDLGFVCQENGDIIGKHRESGIKNELIIKPTKFSVTTGFFGTDEKAFDVEYSIENIRTNKSVNSVAKYVDLLVKLIHLYNPKKKNLTEKEKEYIGKKLYEIYKPIYIY